MVDTTNFTAKTAFRGADENLHVIERFTRIDPETIIYRFTVDESNSISGVPWTGELPMVASAGPLFEYACHEAETREWSAFSLAPVLTTPQMRLLKNRSKNDRGVHL